MYFFIIVFVVLILYFVNKRRVLVKQVDLFNKLLYVEKSPERYIKEIDRLLLKFQSEKENNINLIQKTVGLFYAGKFEEAINILKNDINKIPSNWQVIYYHNLILSLFFNGEIEKGKELFSEAKETIDVFYNKNYNKVSIELIYAVVDFYNGNGLKTLEFFTNLTKTGINDYKIAIGYYFMSKIYDMENKIDESEDCLDKARIYGQGSFIEHL
ncbi:MAG: hypothetical protein WBJ13_10310 [Sedimentibacter sp.]